MIAQVNWRRTRTSKPLRGRITYDTTYPQVAIQEGRADFGIGECNLRGGRTTEWIHPGRVSPANQFELKARHFLEHRPLGRVAVGFNGRSRKRQDLLV